MVEILDFTLREWEQTPGVTFYVEEKIAIANLLDMFGVDIIEACHPMVSKDVFRGVKAITKEGYNAKILAPVHSKNITKAMDYVKSREKGAISDTGLTDFLYQ